MGHPQSRRDLGGLACDHLTHDHEDKCCSNSCKIMENEKMKKSSDVVLYCSIKWAAIVCTSLPLYAIALCLGISATVHYHELVNKTWCPPELMAGQHFSSISNVVSIYYPERAIWTISILISSIPRYLSGPLYRHYYLLYENYKKRIFLYRIGCNLLPILNTIEVSFLILLSVIGIEDSFTVHSLSFILMLITGIISMSTNIVMHYFSGIIKLSKAGRRAFWIKVGLLASFVLLFILIGTAYKYYAWYCQIWAYPMFTICEYLGVINVVAFHGMIYFDMPDRLFVISAGSRLTKDMSVPAVV